jgi:ABC-type glutathione transport system ATPase component
VITHDVDFALSVCDRIALLDEGAIVAEGPAPQILRDAARWRPSGSPLPRSRRCCA